MGVTKKYKRKFNIRGGNNNNNTQKNGRTSLFETIGTAAKNAISGTANFLEEKGARFLGFKRINSTPSDQPNPQSQSQAQIEEQSSQLYQQASNLSTTASNVATGLLNKANQVGAIIVDELNKNIEGPVKNTVSAALSRTVEATKDVLETANEKLNDPALIEDVKEAAENVANTAEVIEEASEPALNNLIDNTSEIGAKAASKIGESSVGVALNTAEAIPGVGAVIGLVRDADNIATAGEAIVEAGAQTAATFADSLVKAEEAIKNKIAESASIKNRISEGVNKFNAADNISKKMGLGNVSNSAMTRASSLLKKGGKLSKKFRKNQRRLSKRLRFK